MSRKLDLSKFRGSDSEDEGPSRPAPTKLALNDLKSRTFAQGITKKSKKDLEKEAEEKKRAEEEEAAARVLAEYEGAFDGSGPAGPSGGARGGGFSRGMRAFGPGGGFVRAGGGPMPYEPPRGPAALSHVPTGPKAMGTTPRTQRAPSPPLTSVPKPKGKRAMDSFLQEIKSNQQQRDQRLGHIARQQGSSVTALAAWEHERGGRPQTEEETTNLFVANLPANITEEILGLFFAELGPIATVKIMWPRGEEAQGSIAGMMLSSRTVRAGLQGFVSYMERKHAEKAVEQMDGLEWMGVKLRVGWSKAIPKPPTARYDLGGRDQTSRRAGDRRAGRSLSRSPSPERKRRRSRSLSNARSPRRRRRSTSQESSSSRSSRSQSPMPSKKKLSNKDKWLERVSDGQDAFVRAIAQRVKDNGKGFEDILRERERDNTKFKFVTDESLPEYHLFRSILDPRYRFPSPEPTGFEDEGYASLYSSDSSEDDEKERTSKGKIGRLARKRFAAMLRAMSGKRVEIARAMEFAMNRAEAADEVAEVICRSLRVDETPVPRKMARLYLVSDILHNSASPLPNVWRYRLAFEQRLPAVFGHLFEVHKSLLGYTGRIAADIFRQQVGILLDTWDRWNVFPGQAGDKLRDLFDGNTTLDGSSLSPAVTAQAADHVKSRSKDQEEPSKFKSSAFKSSFKPTADSVVQDAADVDGEPMAADGGQWHEDDLDGEAMDDAVGDDLDGEAMGDDLDGDVMEDDLDREAI